MRPTPIWQRTNSLHKLLSFTLIATHLVRRVCVCVCCDASDLGYFFLFFLFLRSSAPLFPMHRSSLLAVRFHRQSSDANSRAIKPRSSHWKPSISRNGGKRQRITRRSIWIVPLRLIKSAGLIVMCTFTMENGFTHDSIEWIRIILQFIHKHTCSVAVCFVNKTERP